jgi:hypothetical protein
MLAYIHAHTLTHTSVTQHNALIHIHIVFLVSRWRRRRGGGGGGCATDVARAKPHCITVLLFFQV